MYPRIYDFWKIVHNFRNKLRSSANFLAESSTLGSFDSRNISVVYESSLKVMRSLLAPTSTSFVITGMLLLEDST